MTRARFVYVKTLATGGENWQFSRRIPFILQELMGDLSNRNINSAGQDWNGKPVDISWLPCGWVKCKNKLVIWSVGDSLRTIGIKAIIVRIRNRAQCDCIRHD